MLVLRVLEIVTIPIIVLTFSIVSILVWTPGTNDKESLKNNK